LYSLFQNRFSSPAQEKGLPFRLPPPLGLNGAPRDPLERPRWSKMAPRGPQRAHDGLQEGSRYPKMAQYGLWPPACLQKIQSRPKRFQVPSEAPQDTPKMPQSVKQLWGVNVFAFSSFRCRWSFEASRLPQDGPREPQAGPKTAPRAPKSAPRAPQECPKLLFSCLRGGRLNKSCHV